MLTEKQNEIENKYISNLLKDETLLTDTVIKPYMIQETNKRKLLKFLQQRNKEGLPCDSFSLALEDDIKLNDFGGVRFIEEISKYSPGNFQSLETKIQDYYLINHSKSKAAEFLNEPSKENLTKMVESIDKAKDGINVKSETFDEQLKSVMDKHLNSVKMGLSGVNLGFMNLNNITEGGQPGELYIIGARPSVGKTAFMLNCITEGLREDAKIFPTIFSLETDSYGLINRMIACNGRLNMYKLKNYNRFINDDEENAKKYVEAVNNISKYDMDIRTKENTISQMRSIIRQNKANHPDKKHIIYIDYLTLIKSENFSNDIVREMGDITYGLTRLAKDFKVPVVALAQLTRGIENRQDKRPTMSDLRGGGEIEQAANFIGFLYREDYQNHEADPTNEIELVIQKNRDGETGTLQFKFFKAFQRMVEVN